ncbi:MAG: glutamine amidotransferase, partial [Bacilli bacterium]|nr:glutamine amidotransferase [Bacilli bacterium]
MNIVIAHLYYDILNLYGESGNIDVLEYHLKDNNIKYTIKKLTLEDKLNFDEYDLVYMGSGTENNQKYALNHL